MKDESILEYYYNNVTPEEEEMVKTVYHHEFVLTLVEDELIHRFYILWNNQEFLLEKSRFSIEGLFEIFFKYHLERDLKHKKEQMISESVEDDEQIFIEFMYDLEVRYNRIKERRSL